MSDSGHPKSGSDGSRHPESGDGSEGSKGKAGDSSSPHSSGPPENDNESASEGDARDGAGEPKPQRAPLDARGMARPRFLLDYPEDADLEPLIEAFEAGNYAFVREQAETVAARAHNEAVRDAALELRQRIEPDPLAKYIIAISVALLVFLILWTYLGHDH